MKYAKLILAVTLAASLAAAALAAGDRCTTCGSTAGLRRICRPIHTTRTEQVIAWDVAEDDIALPQTHGLVACNCGGTAGGGCCATGECRSCLAGACAACCKVRPRNRLMRKTFLREVPVVVWIVEYVCAGCAAGTSGEPLHAVPPGTYSAPPHATASPAVPDLPTAMHAPPATEPRGGQREPLRFNELLSAWRDSLRR